jgi:hypothetical protein
MSDCCAVFCLFLGFLLLFGPNAIPEEGRSVLLREEFHSLDRWKPIYFPKIQNHTSYSIQSKGTDHWLRAESNASASALICNTTFDIFEYPKALWRWRVENIYRKANGESKSGDDYPIRIYFLFEYRPEGSGLLDRLKYGVARKLYGEYPPHSAVNYVWSSQDSAPQIITSPYTDRAKVIALQKGQRNVGQWQEEEVNVLSDYRRVFGSDPPRKATIGIMNDSDNTGEQSISWVSLIEIYR